MDLLEPPSPSQYDFVMKYGMIGCKYNDTCNISCCCEAFTGVANPAVSVDPTHGAFSDVTNTASMRTTSSGNSRRSSVGSREFGYRYRGITTELPTADYEESRRYDGPVRVHGSSRPPPGKHSRSRVQYAAVNSSLGGLSRGGTPCCSGKGCVDLVDTDAIVRLRTSLYYDNGEPASRRRIREKILKVLADNTKPGDEKKTMR
jgi:hypothetical protein